MQFVILLLTVGVVFAAPSKSGDQTACGKSAELFFLLDSSSSIWSVHFKEQLVFVQDVIDQFEISPNMTRVGVASFSNSYRSNIPLGGYGNKNDLKLLVGRIRQLLGNTYTFVALDGIRTRGLNPSLVRPGVVRIAIVITDGQSYDPEKTRVAAKRLKDSGVVVFAIGIGSQTNVLELETIASEPANQYVFQVGNYELLHTIKDRLAIGACNVEEIKDESKPYCGASNPADVMFLVDPVEIGQNNSRKILNFIGVLLKDFNMQEGGIHVGLEARSCGSNDIIIGNYTTRANLQTAFKTINIPGLAYMLQQLTTQSFKKENGGRSLARRMAVLFVDDTLYNTEDILNAARRAKSDDIELFVIAIGDSVVPEQLKALCSPSVDQHLFRVQSYDDLVEFIPKFLEKFCHGL